MLEDYAALNNQINLPLKHTYEISPGKIETAAKKTILTKIQTLDAETLEILLTKIQKNITP